MYLFGEGSSVKEILCIPPTYKQITYNLTNVKKINNNVPFGQNGPYNILTF